MKKTRKKGGSLNRENNASNCKRYHLGDLTSKYARDHYDFCEHDKEYIDYPNVDKFYLPSDINGNIIDRNLVLRRFYNWQSLKEENKNANPIQLWEKYNNPDPSQYKHNPNYSDYLYPDITTLEQFYALKKLHKIPRYILDKLSDNPTFEDIKPFLPKLNRINTFKRTRKLPDYRWKDLWDKSRDERQGKKYEDSITHKPIKFNFWDLYDPENPPTPVKKKWW